MRVRRRALILAAAFAVNPIAARSEPDVLDTGEVATLSTAELGELRGGFSFQGVDIRLGAELRTYLNDELVMQTNVSWQSGAGEISRYVSGALTPAAAAGLQAGLMGGAGVTMNVGDRSVYFANQGQTAFVQRADGAIQNIVVNTASNVDIRQEVEATLDLGNFAPFQAQLSAERIGGSIAGMIDGAIARGLGD